MFPDNYSELLDYALDYAYCVSGTVSMHLEKICKCIHKHSHTTIEEALVMSKFIDVLNYLYDTQNILKEIRHESISF